MAKVAVRFLITGWEGRLKNGFTQKGALINE
jgi:hypothetical protein